MDERMLADRALRDLLNSVTVTADLARFRKCRSLSQRILDSVTGKAGRMDRLFDGHVAQSLENLLDLVTEVNNRQALSDETVLILIDRFGSVSRNVTQHKTDIDRLERRLDVMTADIAKLSQRVDWHDLNICAAGLVENGLARLEELANLGTLSLLDLWRFADELWWGAYGILQRQHGDSESARQLKDTMLRKLRLILRHWGAVKDILVMKPLLLDIAPLPAEEAELVDLLMLNPDPRNRALTCAIGNRVAGRPDKPDEAVATPVLVTTERFTERLFDEVRRGARP